MLGNREIKFRFWDLKRKKMFEEVTTLALHWEYDKDPAVYVGGGQYDYGEGRTVPHYSDGSLMQYTGLKDSERQEVYEGDIVCNVFTGEHFEVEWDTIGTGFLFHNTNHERRTHGIDYYEFEDMCGSVGFIVLGNRFEHPHLLKEAESNEKS